MGLRTQKRRRKENRTDYKLRFGLLKSEKPRIAIRKTNRYMIIQLVETDEAKDKIIKGITSQSLLKKGWDEKFKGSLKSIPAAYLTGLLMAQSIGSKKPKEVLLDIGMNRNIYGSRIYSCAKGLIDGGLNIKVDKKAFPSEERLNGEHLKPELKEMISKIKSKLNAGRRE